MLDIHRQIGLASTVPPRPVSRSGGSRPLYGWVRDSLRREILQGVRAPNERLATEKELIEAFGVSRITVRRALRELCAEGLVVTAQGRGIFVARPRVSQELRRMEAFGETVTSQIGEADVRLLSMQEMTPPSRVARELGLAPNDSVTRIRQVQYLRSQPVMVSESFLPLAIGRRVFSRDLTVDTLSVLKNRLGLGVRSARIEIEACHPEPEVQKALALSVEAPVLKLTRVFLDRSGRAFDVECLSFREDTFNCKFRTDPNEEYL
ncbi:MULTISPECIES: GntR family transcriptional regulator [unclassified Thioalkalivibrio]|uniref:GntR family transcriptional regulator n=1 Tax=unclassified Thioalkalivibrio TaxID=2621013 RepID=UPI0009D9CE80|nr:MULTISPECIES: GntR family transcriptional regulator [unclassified Thioalkalivibrio]